MFRHEDGFDDMYDDSENPDSEFYQEPDEDPNAFMYDMVMDLAARGVDVVDSSHEHDVDETMDINDPVMIKVRQAKMHSDKMKKLDAYSKSPEGKSAARSFASSERKESKAGYPESDKVMRGGMLLGCHHGITSEMMSHMHESIDLFLKENA